MSADELTLGLPNEPQSTGTPDSFSAFRAGLFSERPGSSAVNRRQTTFRRLLGVSDVLSISVALYVSAVVVGTDSLTPAAVAVPLLFVLVAKLLGLYDRDAELLHKTTLDEIPKLLGLSTSAALLLWLADGLLIDGLIGRDQVIGFLAILFVGLIVSRSGARALASRTTPVERCLFVGPISGAEEFRDTLANSPAVRAELVGCLPIDLRTDESDADVLVWADRIRTLVKTADVHRIVLGPGASDEQFLDSVRQIKDNEVKVSVMPNVARLVNTSAELDRLNGLTLLGLRRFEMTLSSRFVKRLFDVTGSVLGFAVFFPVLIVTAVAIKLDSRGPVFFRQIRAGRHGEPFAVVKFRSMVEDAEDQKESLRHLNEAEGVFKIADDPRITRVGRVIRRWHVDELPQLFNVVRGEMSLVGPRPLPLDEDRHIEGWHRRRLDLRPGITGAWQVLGSSRIPVRGMVKLDYQYVADWSLWSDVRIVLLTLGHVVRGRGQ